MILIASPSAANFINHAMQSRIATMHGIANPLPVNLHRNLAWRMLKRHNSPANGWSGFNGAITYLRDGHQPMPVKAPAYALSQFVTSSQTLSGNIEVTAVCEPNAAQTAGIAFFLPAATAPTTKNGYLFTFDPRVTYSVGRIWRMTNGMPVPIGTQKSAGNSSKLIGGHPVLLRYHSANGKLEMWVDGILQWVATDTTYTPNGPLGYCGYQSTGSYLSNLKIAPHSGNQHPDLLDSTGKLTGTGISSKTVQNAHIAQGAVTNPGSGSWYSTFGHPVDPTPATQNTWGAWTTLMSVGPMTILNNNDLVEGVVVIGLNPIGMQTNDAVEVQIVNDLNSNVAAPNLVWGQFTRDTNSLPSNWGSPVQAAIGYTAFTETVAGSRTYSIQVRVFKSTGSSCDVSFFFATGSLRDYGA